MKLGFVCGFLFAIVLVLCYWLVYDIFSNEELASKTEWSIVQGFEYEHRSAPTEKIEILKMGEYSVAGIPVGDARREVWIMLNPRNRPYYKQLPKGDYKLSKADLKTIEASGVVISTVENCLESHVDDSK